MLVTGDLHMSKDILRISECLNFLDYLKQYGNEHNDKKLVILGDLFHTSNSIKNQSFIPFFNKLFEFKEDGFEIYIISGNHDQSNNDKDCLAETFRSFAHFIKNSETIEIDGTDYDFLSYTTHPDEIPNRGSVLFTHLEVEGFYFNPKQKCEDNTFTKEMFDQYELVVSGHLHRMQEEDNMLFVGSPYSTRKDEAGHHYFAVVKGTNYELVEYCDAPEYMTVSLEEALTNKDIDYTNKIVEVEIDSKIENFVKLRDILYNKGVVEVSAKYIKPEENIDMGKHTIDTSQGIPVAMVKYLKEVKESGIDNEKLLKCFAEVLKRLNK